MKAKPKTWNKHLSHQAGARWLRTEPTEFGTPLYEVMMYAKDKKVLRRRGLVTKVVKGGE
jgi:hypothetical protein